MEGNSIASVDNRHQSRRPSLARSAALGIVLFVLWLILSGIFEPLLLFFGALSTLVVVFISIRMDVVDNEGFPVHHIVRIIAYVPWLLREIGKANWDVTKLILNPKLPISPRLATFRGSQRTDLGRFIFANSITLTPGTITVGVYGDEFEVHAVTRDAFTGTEEGEMNGRVAQMEGPH
ncbi:MAG TPA: Na+/H+ antiporter subunit E [Longimicrobiaceae bacterium]|nr:Na+/H+ antiporter subunit E [Longimicrobiaceae bacterium]